MEAVIDHSRVGRRDRKAQDVLFAIARLTPPEGGECWPGIRTLAKEAGCNKDTVSRKVAILVEEGELSVRKTGKGRGARTFYRLLLPMDMPKHTHEGGAAHLAYVADKAPTEAYPEPQNIPAINVALSQQVALLRQQVDLLTQNNAHLVAMVTSLSQQMSALMGTIMSPDEAAPDATSPQLGTTSPQLGTMSPHGETLPPHGELLSPQLSGIVPTSLWSMGTIPPPPPPFGDNKGLMSPEIETMSLSAETMSSTMSVSGINVPIDQRSVGTLTNGDINAECPQERPTMSETMSGNVPTLQRGMGTETIETINHNNNNYKTLSPSTRPSPSTSNDPAVHETWNQLMSFVREREERHGRGGLKLDHYQQLSGNIWRLKRYFCETTRLGEIPLDSPNDRNNLLYQWWPTMYDLWTMSDGDMEACQTAIDQAIVELDKWRDGIITSPKSIRNKAKASLAGAKRQSDTGVSSRADLKGMWQQITSTAGVPGGLKVVFAANPKAKSALKRAGLSQSDLCMMRPSEVVFAYKRFEEAYHEV